MNEGIKEDEQLKKFYKECIHDYIDNCNNLEILQFLEPFIKGYIENNKGVGN